MSKIEEMIKELCPKGIEKAKLGDCSDIINGFAFQSKKYVTNGIRVVRISDVQDGYISNEDKKYYPLAEENSINPFILQENDLVISLTGNVGRVAFIPKEMLPAALNQRVACLRAKNNATIKYIFYELYNKKFQKNAMENANGAGQKNLSTKWLTNYMIPLPPLAIQQEIVSVLDSFTTLIDKMKKEVELRKKQLLYYQEKLLKFDRNNTEYVKLKNLFSIRNGYTPSTKNSDFWTNGNIPWFKLEDIRENGTILADSQSHITPMALKGAGLFKANSIILATSATIGVHALITVPHLSNQRFTNFYPKDDYKQKLDMKYVYHYFFKLDNWCKKHVTQGKFAGVNMSDLSEYHFPIPPLSRQQEIVRILDTFETYISKLEKLIALRQKQYEYYREKLLTFE